jgi:PIN domain nuclease of toxin-antitoxin system
MKPYLLDTSILIDWAVSPSNLPGGIHQTLANPRSLIFVSAVSAWEIAIKRKIGKLQSPTDVSRLIRDNRFTELPISVAHGEATNHLPLIHKDPFDRLLVAQAQTEELILITRDKEILKYDVLTLAA